MAFITKESFEKFVKTEFPGREYKWDYKNGNGYMYIQAGSGKKFSGAEVHYEYSNGQVKVHIEGNQWWLLRRDLFPYLVQNNNLKGEVWQKRQNCQWVLSVEEEQIFSLFCKIRDIVEKQLQNYENGISSTDSITLSNRPNVVYESLCLDELLKKNLSIPSYQRIYVWQREQVLKLLDDIVSIKESVPYHMGAVILHEHKANGDNFDVIDDIVDGQQRLVTISLIQKAIYSDKANSDINRFLENKYASNEAIKNITANYRIILNYLADKDKADKIKTNIEQLLFSVLIIRNTDNLDLAFTFFSNTNSRGKKLTDYDLLKPHHLRFIPSDLEEQQMHLAKKWDSMILGNMDLEKENRASIEYVRMIETCLYRLRKWALYRQENLSENHYIKKEFEATLIIPEIPPFGEQFNFNEPIQGGQHFFAYIEHFLDRYKEFELKKNIQCAFGLTGSCSWYGNVVEALVFCYFLKFGNSYIAEAMLSILRYISVIRFNKKRAYEPTILEWVKNSKITMLIMQATSPTFFLAAIEHKIDNIQEDENAASGVRKAFLRLCENLSNELNQHTTVQYYHNYFKNRYGNISINS